MKEKGNPDCEGSGGERANPRDPRSEGQEAEKPKRKAKYRTTTARAATRHKISKQRERERAARAAEIIEASKAAIAAAPKLAVKPSNAERRARSKEERRMERQRAELARNSALARLLVNGRIDRHMYEAGVHLRHLWVTAMPGMPAMNYMRPKVDGGGARREAPQLALLIAERELKALLVQSGVGDDAAEVLQMVCRDDMMLTPVAIMIEEDEKMRREGTATRETQAIVRYLLRGGLTKVWNTLKRREAPRIGAASMRAWLAEGARPTFETTVAGERHDLSR